MIKTISNYSLSIPFVSPLTSVKCSEYTLKLYIWSGDKLDVPATADYELTKPNYADSNGTDTIQIARLLNSLIEFTPNVSVTTGLASSINQKWCKIEVYYTTTDPLDDDVAQLEDTQLVLKGYGYGNEGSNPQPPANRIYVAGIDYKVSRSTIFNIPIYLNEA